MKTAKQVLLLLCTLALVGLGAAMPWLSTQMEDKRINDLRDEFGLDDLSLILRRDSEAEDTLRLLGGTYNTLNWSGETVLDPGDVAGAARVISKQLVEKGLFDERYILDADPGGMDVVPLLIVSEDGAFSAVVWLCAWGEQNSRYFYLDDASGKLVGGWFRRSGKLSGPEFNEQLREWVRFCEDYYGVSVANIGWANGNPVMNGELIGGSAFVMTLQPEQGESFELRLIFYELTVEFNAQKDPTDADSMAKGY